MTHFTDNPPLSLGTKTPWGTVQAVALTGGERYYWMQDRSGVISMMPWFVVEPDSDKPGADA
jgi:hypothetical protein